MVVLAGIGIVVAGLLAVGVALDALAVRRGLVTAEDHVDAARGALLDGDVPTAAGRLEQARASLATPLARTRRPLWRVAERVPVIGRTARTLTAVVDTADAATGLGRRVITAADDLVGDDARLTIRASGGRIDLTPLQAARTALVDLDTARLANATTRLRAARPGPAPAEVADARGRLLALADRTLQETASAARLVDVLPTFLGGEGSRRYLLALQNPAELRGTGGLIGFYAVVTAEDGRFTLSRPDPFEVLNEVEGRLRTDPVDAPTAFTERYAPANAAGFLANANVDPDLPTVAPILLDLYRKRTGQVLDGVVAIDPMGLEAIMRTVGPVALPQQQAAPGLPNPVPAPQIAETLMVHAYEVLGGDTPEREDYLRAFTVAAFEQLFAGGWDALDVAPAVARTAVDGHLQLWSRSTEEQQAFEGLRVAGRLAPASEAHDLLAVTANNAAGNKADVFVAHALTGLIQLVGAPDRPGRITDLTVTVRNGLPASGLDDYFLQSATPGRGFIEGFRGPRGLNRTWFSVWMPTTAAASGLQDGDEDLPISSSDIGDRRALDHVLEVPAGETADFSTTITGPVDLQRDGDALVYRLTLHRQPKAVPDRVGLTIGALDGWLVSDVELEGGGSGEGFGAHGEAGPLIRATVEDGKARLEGDITRSVDVVVRMTPVS